MTIIILLDIFIYDYIKLNTFLFTIIKMKGIFIYDFPK